jgi:serine/threonine protein kinase
VWHADSLCACCLSPASPLLLQLADFGFSKDANQHSAPTSRVGTPAYLAPEVITNQPGQIYDGQVRQGLPLATWPLLRKRAALAVSVPAARLPPACLLSSCLAICRKRMSGPAACCSMCSSTTATHSSESAPASQPASQLVLCPAASADVAHLHSLHSR